jgi:hypothetical protein
MTMDGAWVENDGLAVRHTAKDANPENPWSVRFLPGDLSLIVGWETFRVAGQTHAMGFTFDSAGDARAFFRTCLEKMADGPDGEVKPIRVTDAVADALVAFLNSLVEIDQYAVHELISCRVPCNRQMAEHPSVQVAAAGDEVFVPPGQFRVGMLGVLNGFMGAAVGVICADFDARGRLVGFRRTLAHEVHTVPLDDEDGSAS